MRSKQNRVHISQAVNSSCMCLCISLNSRILLYYVTCHPNLLLQQNLDNLQKEHPKCPQTSMPQTSPHPVWPFPFWLIPLLVCVCIGFCLQNPSPEATWKSAFQHPHIRFESVTSLFCLHPAVRSWSPPQKKTSKNHSWSPESRFTYSDPKLNKPCQKRGKCYPVPQTLEICMNHAK